MGNKGSYVRFRRTAEVFSLFFQKNSLCSNFTYKIQNFRIYFSFLGESHSCVLPLNKLTPIFMRQMEVPKIHLGKFLVCRTISKGKTTVGTTILVEDLNGDVEELGLYNFRPVLDRDGSWIAPGTILAIKEPYLKYGILNVFIRIDSPSDVLFVQETDEKSLEEVGAMKWYYIKINSSCCLNITIYNDF